MKAALLAEVADILAGARYLNLACVPTVEMTEDGLVLTVRLDREAQETVHEEVMLVQLLCDLQRLADTATMRALCARYGLDPHWLEHGLADKDKEQG